MPVAQIEINVDQLRGMIGSDVTHRGSRCRVIEVIEDGPALVLQDLEKRDMQADQYGDPRRRVPTTYTVPVLDAERRSINPDFLALQSA